MRRRVLHLAFFLVVPALGWSVAAAAPLAVSADQYDLDQRAADEHYADQHDAAEYSADRVDADQHYADQRAADQRDAADAWIETNASVMGRLAVACAAPLFDHPVVRLTMPERLPFLRSAIVAALQSDGTTVLAADANGGLSAALTPLDAGVTYDRAGRGMAARPISLAIQVRLTSEDGEVLHRRGGTGGHSRSGIRCLARDPRDRPAVPVAEMGPARACHDRLRRGYGTLLLASQPADRWIRPSSVTSPVIW